VKDFLRMSDLSPAGLARLLNFAAATKRNPRAWRSHLAGETVVCYFATPSTRTRLSFGTAIALLGGVPQAVGPVDLQLGRGETIEDTARVVSSYAAAFVIRTFADDDVARFARAASIPVVNALTDGHHPCQALADLLTLQEKFGRLPGMRLAYLGDGNNVAHSLLEGCALAGVDVAVATPRDYEPDAEVVETARRIALRSGAQVLVTHNPHEAVEGAHAVYTDVWASTSATMTDARRAALTPYRVDATTMARARPDAVFMHCLPVHRGEEVTAEVVDGAQSIVFRQAENRVPTAAAVLVGLCDRTIVGAGTPEPAAR